MNGIAEWVRNLRCERIIGEILDHMRLVEETVDYLGKAYEELNKGNVKEASQNFEAVILKEKDADELRRRIVSDMERSKLPPKETEDLLGLLRKMDMVADWAKEATRITLILDYNSLPKVLREILMEIVKTDVRTVKALSKSIRSLIENPREVPLHVGRVELLEERVDDLQFEALKLMTEVAEEVKPVTLILIGNLLNSLEQIADNSEDTADYIQAISVRKM